MVLLIYQTDVFKECLLPNGDNMNYSLHLSNGIFHLQESLEIRMDITSRKWRMKRSDGYTIYCRGEAYEEKELRDGDILYFKTEANEEFQIIVVNPTLSEINADAKFTFPIFEKYDISQMVNITFGKDKSNMIAYEFMDLISKNHGGIVRHGDGCYVEAYGPNGVFIHSRRVKKQRLSFGEIINVFGLHIIYMGEFIGVAASYGKVNVDGNYLKPYAPAETHNEAVSLPQGKKKLYFNRSPRYIPGIIREKVEIEAPPPPRFSKKKPLLYTIGPSMTMTIPMMLGCLLAIYGSRTSGGATSAYMYTGIITAIGSAALGVMWAVLNLRYTKAEEVEEEQIRFHAYGNYLNEISDKVKGMYENNRNVLRSMYPSAQKCCNYNMQTTILWNRNENHEDFLFIRLGTGNIPFQTEVTVPKEKFTVIYDALKKEPAMIAEKYRMLEQVPVGIDLSKSTLVGMIGGAKKAGAILGMHNIVAQIAANHCYTEVKLVFIYDSAKEEDAGNWAFAKWLPHVWSEDKNTRYVAENKLEASDLFFELANIFRQRKELRTSSYQKELRAKPHYVIFLSETEMLEGEPFAKYIYESGEEDGITTFLMSDTYQNLPNNCETIIQNGSGFSGTYQVLEGNSSHQEIIFDSIHRSDLEQLARRLMNIEVNETQSTKNIPNSLDFFEMYGVRSLKELKVLERWQKNRTYNTMKALIGQKAGGVDCYLDIHEKYHGPHGLIAGTTGSGKSETLQTYILSLAVNNSPLDVSFFVIDFKGGGMADLFTGLPHMIGQISNLSGNQVHRAMVSIKSENMRRQRLFREHGVNNINLYTKLFKNNEASVAIPHLFIIIDEFAELKREEPDFMKELISVAQVGRSLGVHLILATQKPSGTVDDNIWSNSKFRLCLRVQDKQDSNDMLHKPDAAFITLAGRGYLQVGNDEIYELFQSGFSGAIYEEDSQDAGKDIASMITMTGKTAIVGNRLKKRKQKENAGAVKAKEKTQLDAVVDYLKNLAEEEGFCPDLMLWLPVLPEELYLPELDGYEVGIFDGQNWHRSQEEWNLTVYMGLCDDPVNQAQMPLRLDFAENGHHAACGIVTSGKSTFLQTLMYSMITKYTPRDVHIYGLDFSSHMLEPFEQAPHVGGILYEHDLDKIGKCFHMLDEIMQERSKLFGGGNYSQYVRAKRGSASGVVLPAILIVIDNYSAFREKTENQYDEEMIKISAKGVSCGIFLMITAAGFGMAEIPNRVGDNIRTVISLEQTDKFKYMDVLKTTSIGVVPEAGVKGRGLAYVDGRLLEYQTALPVAAIDGYARGAKIKELCLEMAAAFTGEPARQVPFIPEDPILEDWMGHPDYQASIAREDLLPFGYYGEDASICGMDLSMMYCYLISGKKRTGKTNLLKVMLMSAGKKGAKCTVIEHGGAELKKPALEAGAGYISGDQGVSEFFSQLLPEFAARNQKKRQILEDGGNEQEVYEALKKETPIFIFIADIVNFIGHVYRKQGEVVGISGFLENITERGILHNIYFIGCLNSDESNQILAYKAFKNMAGYKTGVHLGGNIASQRMYDFQNIPFKERGKAMKKGTGLTPSPEDETVALKVVIPRIHEKGMAAQ